MKPGTHLRFLFAAIIAHALVVAPDADATVSGGEGDCKLGKDTAYLIWIEGLASGMADRGIIDQELSALRADLNRALNSRDLSVSSELCANPVQIERLRSKNQDTLQGLLDHHVLMAMVAAGTDLEYYVLPYLLGENKPPGLMVRASCGSVRHAAAEKIDSDRPGRMQAYVYSALALYEIRRQESHRDACGSRRAEILIQRALMKVQDLTARAATGDGAERLLLEHLRVKCRVLESGIDQLSGAADAKAPEADNCGIPRESRVLVGRDAKSVCEGRP